MELIKKYFTLTEQQQQQFAALEELFLDWNSKINLISRKDTEHFYEHHVLHSLGIARCISFRHGTRVLDVGTGGGFPGVPLAILFPSARFFLLDSIGKKLRAASEIAAQLQLNNIEFIHKRIEDERREFDFAVSRAVMPLADLVRFTRKNIHRRCANAIPNGLLCLKGGDLTDEVRSAGVHCELHNLSNDFEEAFFETKHVVYVAYC